MADKTSHVPRNWEVRRVEDLADTYAGGTPSRSARGMFGGSIPWIKSMELNQGIITSTDEKLTEKGYRSASVKWISQNTPLVAMYGATAGVVAWLQIRAVSNQAVLAVNPFEGVVSRWLYWALSFHTPNMLRRLQGSGQPNLSKTLIDQLEMPVPSLPEQRRIAEILDAADEIIRQTERVIAKLREVKKGLLHDLLTRGLDADGNLRDPDAHPEQFKDSPLGKTPREWKVADCESVCVEITVGIVIKPTQYYVSAGVPALRSANIREEGIVLDDLVYISEESNSSLPKSRLRKGDVVTVRTGYPGTSCVVPPELDGVNCIDLLISRPGNSIVSKYLAVWINSDFGKSQVLRRQGGLAQQHFNVGELRDLLIALPSLSEQSHIAAALDAHDARIRAEKATLDKLRQVKRGLMDDLLTGRVRV